MTLTAAPAPATATRVICVTCRHPRPLHSDGGAGVDASCKARGCHGGPDGGPCEHFTPEPEGTVPAQAAPGAVLTAPAAVI